MTVPEYASTIACGSWPCNPPLQGFGYLAVLGQVRYPLYRYTKRAWYEASRFSGQWYLGTLYGYRDLAIDDEGRADTGEGSRWDSEAIPRMAGVQGLLGGNARNTWTMCCAQKRSDQFYSWKDNDCCLEIFDPRFFLEICAGMGDRAAHGVIAEVGYASYDEVAETIVKRSGFRPDVKRWKLPDCSWQGEIRLMIEPWSPFTPRQGDKMPFDFGDPSRNTYQPTYFPHLKPALSYAPAAAKYVRLVEHRPR